MLPRSRQKKAGSEDAARRQGQDNNDGSPKLLGTKTCVIAQIKSHQIGVGWIGQSKEEVERLKEEKEAHAKEVQQELRALKETLQELKNPWWKKWFTPSKEVPQ